VCTFLNRTNPGTSVSNTSHDPGLCVRFLSLSVTVTPGIGGSLVDELRSDSKERGVV
jgi:hypothetical protein